MSDDSLKPIPVPIQQRWRDLRLHVLPPVVFGSALVAIAFLWKDHVAAPTMVGQAEPVVANVSSYKPGVLAELTVGRFQKVRAGDPIGLVMITDPKILASSLAVIQAEIEMLRVNMKPIVAQQHSAMDYDQFRLNWMRQRTQLASAQVDLQLAQTEFRRMDELFKDKIVSERVHEQAKANQDRLQTQVDELSKSVAEGERSITTLQLSNRVDLGRVSEDPLRVAIAVQESKLKLTEAELSPIYLRAPMDGIVSTIYHRAGEAVSAGQPIVSIATFNPVRIVGYLRPPILEEPKVGMSVRVRTRGLHREEGNAKIVEVGSQMEAVPASLQTSIKLATLDLGLPIDISLPPSMKIRPGELVDITLLNKAN
jgi:multidrug resistance efflux pump